MLPGHSDSWEGVMPLLALPPSVALGPRATDHLIFQELVWNTAKLLHLCLAWLQTVAHKAQKVCPGSCSSAPTHPPDPTALFPLPCPRPLHCPLRGVPSPRLLLSSKVTIL